MLGERRRSIDDGVGGMRDGLAETMIVLASYALMVSSFTYGEWWSFECKTTRTLTAYALVLWEQTPWNLAIEAQPMLLSLPSSPSQLAFSR